MKRIDITKSHLFFQKQDSEKNILSITDVAEIWEEIVKPFYYHSSVIIKFAKKCQRKFIFCFFCAKKFYFLIKKNSDLYRESKD